MSDQIITNLEKRIHNLENAFMSFMHLVQDLQPPETQKIMDLLARDLFENSQSVGAFNGTPVIMRNNTTD